MSSTCEMVYNIINTSDSKLLDKKIACCLYTGIMTDTGSFRYPSTNAKTHKVVSHLISLGANGSDIHQKIFDSSSAVIAGKTGTAQIKSILPNKEYDAIRENPSLRDHALFVGYAPIPDPELLILVIIENGESGSRVAAPIAKAGFDYYLTKNE